MSAWINRTDLSGSSINANGTNSHTCTFTAATSGNFLVAIVAGAVTFSTPTGWTLVESIAGNSGMYVFSKTASNGESSFATTHNGSDYPIRGIVYEFPAGTSVLSSNNVGGLATDGTPSKGPSVSSLTGTYTGFSARRCTLSSGSCTWAVAWLTPGIEDYDTYTPKGTQDGVALTIGYDDSQTGSSFTASAQMTTTFSSNTAEGVAFALSIGAGGDSATGVTAWLKF